MAIWKIAAVWTRERRRGELKHHQMFMMHLNLPQITNDLVERDVIPFGGSSKVSC